MPQFSTPSRVYSRALALSLLLAGALAGEATAIEVQLVAVSPGSSAEVSIDGATPITIGVGETVEGVTLLSADRRGAVVRVGGAKKTLSLVSYRGPTRESSSETITLRADAAGHFFANGSINGTPVRFLVDTGATSVALSRTQAQRIGIDYRAGTPMLTQTANGVIRGWRVRLDSLSIGGTTVYDVSAVVGDVDDSRLSIALLGMTYLNHFDMQRQGPTLVLRRR